MDWLEFYPNFKAKAISYYKLGKEYIIVGSDGTFRTSSEEVAEELVRSHREEVKRGREVARALAERAQLPESAEYLPLFAVYAERIVKDIEEAVSSAFASALYVVAPVLVPEATASNIASALERAIGKEASAEVEAIVAERLAYSKLNFMSLAGWTGGTSPEASAKLAKRLVVVSGVQNSPLPIAETVPAFVDEALSAVGTSLSEVISWVSGEELAEAVAGGVAVKLTKVRNIVYNSVKLSLL